MKPCIAWFHHHNWPADKQGLIVERANPVILTKGDEAGRDALRKAGSPAPILDYKLLLEVQNPVGVRWAPWPNNWFWKHGDYAAATVDMFLHKADGTRITGENGMRYLDPRSVSAQLFVMRRATEWTQLGWDGLFLDNVRLGWDMMIEKAKSTGTGADGRPVDVFDIHDGQGKRYETEADFVNAVVQFVAVVKQAIGAKLLWGNMIDDPFTGTSWDPYLPLLDGAQNEAFATGWPKYPNSPRRIANEFTQAESWLAAGKAYHATGQGQQADQVLLQFHLAAFYMITDGTERSSMRYSLADPGYGHLWWSSLYDLDLGNPLGPRTATAYGFERRFERGIARVDTVRRIGTINLEQVTPTPTPEPTPAPIEPAAPTPPIKDDTMTIDLTPQKLTLPLNRDGQPTGYPAMEIKQPALAKYESPYMRRQSDGSIILTCPVSGARTSTNTKYARTEFREMIADGSDEAEWKTEEGGKQVVELAVLRMPRLIEGERNAIIVLQFHGPKDEPMRVYFDWTTGVGVLRFADDKGRKTGKEEFFTLLDAHGNATAIPLGKDKGRFRVVGEMDATGIRVTATHNGVVYTAFSPLSDFWRGKDQYGKTGVYLAVGDEASGSSNIAEGEAVVQFFVIDAPVHPHALDGSVPTPEPAKPTPDTDDDDEDTDEETEQDEPEQPDVDDGNNPPEPPDYVDPNDTDGADEPRDPGEPDEPTQPAKPVPGVVVIDAAYLADLKRDIAEIKATLSKVFK